MNVCIKGSMECRVLSTHCTTFVPRQKTEETLGLVVAARLIPLYYRRSTDASNLVRSGLPHARLRPRRHAGHQPGFRSGRPRYPGGKPRHGTDHGDARLPKSKPSNAALHQYFENMFTHNLDMGPITQ